MNNVNVVTAAKDFITNAQKNFNERNITDIIAVYQTSAILEFWTEGIYERFDGQFEIQRAWQFIFETFPEFRVNKRLVSADSSGAIVNEWEGSFSGSDKRRSIGLDLWWCQSDGKVSHHKVFSFGHVVPYESWRGKLRWLLVNPTLSIQTLRGRQKAGLL